MECLSDGETSDRHSQCESQVGIPIIECQCESQGGVSWKVRACIANHGVSDISDRHSQCESQVGIHT